MRLSDRTGRRSGGRSGNRTSGARQAGSRPTPGGRARLQPGCHDGALRRLPAFRELTEAELEFIRGIKRGHLRLSAQQDIISEGQPCELYTLAHGWAFRYKSLSDGRRQILNFLLPGDLIGLREHGLTASPYGVEALTEVEICEFPRDSLWDLYREFPSLAYDVTWLAAREEAMVDENLLSVGRRTAAERLAMLLIHIYKRASSVGLAQEGLVPFPITQQQLADAAGLSLVHTNKTLRKLHKQGMFEISDGRMRVMRPSALAHLAEYYDSPVKVRPMI